MFVANLKHIFALKNVNFFIVKVLVKSDKGGCEVTLIFLSLFELYLIQLSSFRRIIPIFGYKNSKVMENIGDWFYIVLLVIFGTNALIGFFFKKKVETGVPGQTDIDPQFDLDTFWEPEEEEPEPEPVENPVKEPLFVPHEQSPKKKRPVTHYTPLSKIKEKESEAAPIIQLDSTDDLKKAIICSEIFNRKF